MSRSSYPSLKMLVIALQAGEQPTLKSLWAGNLTNKLLLDFSIVLFFTLQLGPSVSLCLIVLQFFSRSFLPFTPSPRFHWSRKRLLTLPQSALQSRRQQALNQKR